MSRTDRLLAVLAANLVLVGALAGVGIAAHSLGVFAEGADYLGDAAAIAVSLLAIDLARRPTTPHRGGGHPRATRYAALVNAGWLLILSLLVIAGAADRLANGVHEVHGLPVLVVSGVAALVMLGAALLLGGDSEPLADPVSESVAGADPGPRSDPDAASLGGDRRDEVLRDEHERLNVTAVLLDTAADAAAAAGVALTGGIIYATGGNDWLDPAVAMLVALVVAYDALRLLGRVRASLRRPLPS